MSSQVPSMLKPVRLPANLRQQRWKHAGGPSRIIGVPEAAHGSDAAKAKDELAGKLSLRSVPELLFASHSSTGEL